MDSKDKSINLIRPSDLNVEIQPKVVKHLVKYLCRKATSDEYDSALAKIRKASRIKIKTPGLFHKEIVSVSPTLVKEWSVSVGLDSIHGIKTDHDLVIGKYEGGFKVWESSLDLVKFICDDKDFISKIIDEDRSNLRIIELGAGASLPSIALLSRLMQELPDFRYQIHMQDYNWQVLASFTLLNLAINLNKTDLKNLLKDGLLQFYHGDWKVLAKKNSETYDVILMSEVLYNADNYPVLHNLIDKILKPDGLILLATKRTYFGLSGDVLSWSEYIENENKFSIVHTIDSCELCIPRCILIMKRKCHC